MVRISRITANCTPAAPLLNRASAGLFIPGSTFKVITVSAALESKKFGPGSTFYDPGYCTVYGKRVSNFADQNGPEVFGTINLVTGLVHSVNSVFCNIGLKLGAKRDPRHGQTVRLLRATTTRDAGRRAAPERPLSERAPLLPEGRRERRRRTDGVRTGADARHAAPDGDGRRRARLRREADGAARRRQHRQSRRQGRRRTGAAPHPSGCQRADGAPGRVHDASRRARGNRNRRADLRILGRRQDGDRGDGVAESNTTWFIAFAGKDAESPPEVAIAVVLQNQSGVGGTTAAPIARTVMQAILQGTENP